jgi:hypothetical protein
MDRPMSYRGQSRTRPLALVRAQLSSVPYSGVSPQTADRKSKLPGLSYSNALSTNE